MSKLGIITAVLGVLLSAIYAFFVINPKQAQKGIKLFPRNRTAGIILTFINIAWAEWLIYETSFGRFEHLKTYCYILGPVFLVLILIFMKDLLASRSLGGLMLLTAAPIIDGARMEESAFRYVMLVFAYIIIIKGIILILSPYKFRKWTELMTKKENRIRLAGSAGLAFSIFILILSLLVF